MVRNIFILVFLSASLISCNIFKCKKSDTVAKLEGNWELSYIAGPGITFDLLYPDKKPTINFKIKEIQVSGNTGCNSFTGKLNATENKLDFTQPMVMTRMMCGDGQGEQVFINTLKKTTSYKITDEGKTLIFVSGDIAMMRFTKK